MTDKTIFELQAETCKALSHPLRQEVIHLLGDGELSFSEILKETGGLKSNLSQHLRFMVQKGLLVARKDGTSVFFRLSSTKVKQACALMQEVLLATLGEKRKILDALSNRD